jgi:hypothetical protein
MHIFFLHLIAIEVVRFTCNLRLRRFANSAIGAILAVIYHLPLSSRSSAQLYPQNYDMSKFCTTFLFQINSATTAIAPIETIRHSSEARLGFVSARAVIAFSTFPWHYGKFVFSQQKRCLVGVELKRPDAND